MRLRAALRVAFGVVGTWHVTLDILHLPLTEGGYGLWMPDVHLLTAHASSFWRYLQQPTCFGLHQRTVLRGWLEYKGVVHIVQQLPLLQLSPCTVRGAPWLAYSDKAVSELNKPRPGLSMEWNSIASARLWNSRLLAVKNQTVTCRYFISRSILCVRDLVTGSWSHLLTAESRGHGKLRLPFWDKLSTVLPTLVWSWESHLPVNGLLEPHDMEGGLRLSPLSQGVACSLRTDRRQDLAMWRAFHCLRLPPQDLDFIHTALWKKLAVGVRLRSIFPSIPPTCSVRGAREDVYHRVKACSWLVIPVRVPVCTFAVVHSASGCAPTNQLCSDYPKLSLT